MRLVLDTNVYVSALLSRRGAPGQLLDLVRNGRCSLVTSRAQLDELTRVLTYDRIRERVKADEAAAFVDGLQLNAEVVTDLPAVRLSPDPDDDVILATAIAGRADALVTGDKRDLLALGPVQGLRIVTASALLAELEPAS